MEWELFHVEQFHSETSIRAERGKVQIAAKASSRGHWQRLGCRQWLAASCPLPPSGQPRGDDSICKPAPSTSSQHTQTLPTTPSPKTNLPFATVAARNLPVCHSRATHSPHPGLPAHPRMGTETTDISEGRLQNRRAGGNTALEQEGRGLLGLGGTAAGVIPPRTVTARDGRDNLVFNSRVSEHTHTPPRQGRCRGWPGSRHCRVSQLQMARAPPPPPPPTFGVCLKYLDVDFVSPAHLQLKHSFLFTGPLPVTGSQSSEEAFIS